LVKIRFYFIFIVQVYNVVFGSAKSNNHIISVDYKKLN